MITVGEVFDKISARQVPFEMVDRVLKSMTEEGGKFYKMQEVQAETLKGKIANLTDAYHIMFSEIGERGEGIMKRTVDNLRYMMYFYEDTGRKIMELVAVYGIYKATLIAVEILTKTFTLANHRLLNSLVKIGARLVSNPYALLAAGIAGVGYHIYKVSTAETALEKAQRRLNDVVGKFNANLDTEIAQLDYLWKQLKKAKAGTKEYEVVRSEILRNYDSYLDAIDKEALKVGNLVGIYEKLKSSVEEAMKEKAFSEGAADLFEDYNNASQQIMRKLTTSLKSAGAEYKKSSKELADYVRGKINLEDLSEDARKAFDHIKRLAERAVDTGFGSMGSADAAAENLVNKYLQKGRNAFFDPEQLREDLQSSREIYNNAMSGLADDLEIWYGVQQAAATDTERQLSETALKIQAIFRKFGIESQQKAFGLWADESFDRTKYLEDLRKSYAEIGDKIRDAGDASDSILPGLKQQKQIIEEIARVMQIDLVLKKEGGSGKSQAQKDLEEQIRMIEDVKKAYEKLSEYLDGQTLSDTLSAIFTDLDDKDLLAKFDFRERIIKLALELKFDKGIGQSASLATDKADRWQSNSNL